MNFFDDADLIIVGAGFYGMTIAERAASEGFRVAILEKRDHIGGNAYSYADPATGIEIHKYGPHIFHTNNERIFEYLSRFTEWETYEQRVWTMSRGRVYPLPINLATIGSFAGRAMTPDEARAWVKENAGAITQPNSLEEKAIALIGRPLYEALVRGYTLKQWQTDPQLLPPDIISRLPVRYNYDNRYFNDTHQCLPRRGYTAIFERMSASERISVHLGVDWFDVRWARTRVPVVYTGPIDRFFDYRLGVLGWRTIDLSFETLEIEDFQGCPVMNYADADVPWTRISEFKHFRPWREALPKTVIAREYSRAANVKDDPYYPVNLVEDKRKYLGYRELARDEKDVVFGGRLGAYRYLDMHQAVAAALNAWERRLRPRLTRGEALADVDELDDVA